MRGSQEDKRAQVPNILGVVRKVRVELEVKIDVEADSVDNGEAIGEVFLIDNE